MARFRLSTPFEMTHQNCHQEGLESSLAGYRPVLAPIPWDLPRSSLPSHVLTAMGVPPNLIASSIRLSIGKTTTDEEIDRFVDLMPRIVSRLRSISAPSG